MTEIIVSEAIPLPPGPSSKQHKAVHRTPQARNRSCRSSPTNPARPQSAAQPVASLPGLLRPCPPGPAGVLWSARSAPAALKSGAPAQTASAPSSAAPAPPDRALSARCQQLPPDRGQCEQPRRLNSLKTQISSASTDNVRAPENTVKGMPVTGVDLLSISPPGRSRPF
jgi:hypothetical protein